jgi:hypothetical protein
VHIPRLDLDLKGVDAAVAREALDRLPAQLASALPAAPAASGRGSPAQLPAPVDATRLAARLAQEIAAIVRRRTGPTGALKPRPARGTGTGA